MLYTYDASGTKLKSEAPNNLNTFYAGGFEYRADNSLLRIGLEEGQLANEAGVYSVQYYLKDHLGNVRAVMDESGTIIQETEYYAFGLPIQRSGSDKNKYLYNGKEKQPQTEWLDYGARMYDPTIGRWMVIDRYSEKYANLSPYQFAANNSIGNIDVNGDSILISHNNESILYHDGKLFWANSGLKTYDGKSLNKKGNITGFVGQVYNALQKIENGGEAGNDLITKLQNDNTFTQIREATSSVDGEGGGNAALGKRVFWSPANQIGGRDENGNNSRDAYIGLAHELAHVYDQIDDGIVNRDPWYKYRDNDGNLKSVPVAEIFATHFENRIRAENNMPLRAYYSSNKDENARIINVGTRSSLYYTDPTRPFPSPLFMYQYKKIP